MSRLIVFNDEDEYYKYCQEHEDRIILVYEEDVYDVTDFLEEHPGGPDIIEDYNTNDITELFHSKNPHAHSKRALLTLFKYKIGYFRDEDASLFQKQQEAFQFYPRVADRKVLYKEFSVDLSKGLLAQVSSLNVKHYINMIQNPIELPPFKVTNNPILEALISPKLHYSILLWVSVLIYLIWNDFSNKNTEQSIKSITRIIFFFIGVLLWTLVEYLLYRFFFSAEENLIDNKLVIWLHFILYGKHKISPSDKTKVGTPLIFSFWLLFGFYFILINIFSAQIGMTTFAGMVIGFITYEYIHYQIHSSAPNQQYLGEMQKYHMNFHTKKGKRGYGVTTKLWDKILGTEID